METSDAPSPKEIVLSQLLVLWSGMHCECIPVSCPRKNPSRWREAYLCRTSDEGKTTSKKAILRCAHERNDARGSIQSKLSS